MVFIYTLFSTGLLMNISSEMGKLTGSALIDKNDNKPVILEVISSSGGEKVSEDVVLFVDVIDEAKIKSIEYSLDNITWNKIDRISYDDGVVTGKVVFTKNMNNKVYLRAVNEYDNVSEHRVVNVHIEK